MVPIEDAVHARLVREGLERAKSSPQGAASDGAQDAEGRLTRAGRCTHADHISLHCFSQVKRFMLTLYPDRWLWPAAMIQQVTA